MCSHPPFNVQVVSSSDLEGTYAALSRTEYTWEELQQRPLPPGVDPARIETYLSTSTFQVLSNLGFEVLMIELMPGCISLSFVGSNWSIILLHGASHQIKSLSGKVLDEQS